MLKTNLEYEKYLLERTKALFPAGRQSEIKPQKSQLRFLAKFQKGRGNYEFKVPNTGLTNPHVTARHLERDDMLVAKSVFVGIYIEPTAKPGHGVIVTYPMLNGDGLPTGYAGLANTDGEALYNGELNLRTGSVVNFDSFPLLRFRTVPETQPVPILGDGGFKSAGLIPQFNFNGAAVDFAEFVQFRGDTDQRVTIDFPFMDSSEIKAADGFDAYLIVIFDGWKVQNGASILRLEA